MVEVSIWDLVALGVSCFSLGVSVAVYFSVKARTGAE